MYPFTCPESELPAMLDWVLDSLIIARRELEPIKQMIVERNSWPAFKNKMQKVLDAVKDSRQVEPFYRFRNMALSIIEHQNRNNLAFDVSLKATKSLRGWPAVQAVRSAYACYQAVRDMDDMSSAIPVFQAKKESATEASKGAYKDG